MDLIFNDLSIHEQFHGIAAFREAIGRIMALRRIARNFHHELHCHRSTVNRRINSSISVFDAVQTFTRDEKRALLSWLTQQGPFWEDVPVHDSNDWLECGDEIVTETAVGEAAYCSTVGIDRRLVSLIPSKWKYSPINVAMLTNGSTDIEVNNYWSLSELEDALRGAEPPIASWCQLEAVSKARFQRLRFSVDSFRYLDGQPFVPGASERILSRLGVLDRLMESVDDSGRCTPEGHRLYQDHFTGDKAGFSDSSDTEKREFEKALTFPHPEASGHSPVLSMARQSEPSTNSESTLPGLNVLATRYTWYTSV